MITTGSQQMRSRQVPKKIEAGRIFHQLRSLTNEAIDILYDDGLLPYDYINALSFRLQEYFTRELKTLRKIFEQNYLGPKLVLPVKRPRRLRKLDVSCIIYIYKSEQTYSQDDNYAHDCCTCVIDTLDEFKNFMNTVLKLLS